MNTDAFTKEQKAEICRGADAGVNYRCYADPKFTVVRMNTIRNALMDNINIEPYVHPDLDIDQLRIIILGVRKGLDVSSFAKPGIPAKDMLARMKMMEQEIAQKKEKMRHRMEFERAKKDPNSYYHKPYYYKNKVYTYRQMSVIQHGLNEGFDVSVYEDPRFSAEQMKVILDGLRAGVPVTIYAKLSFGLDAMILIYKGLKKGLDVTTYANPAYPYKRMKALYLKALDEHKPVEVKREGGVVKMSDLKGGKTSKIDKPRIRTRIINRDPSKHPDVSSNAVKTMRIE